MEKKTSDAQVRASRRWEEKNKERTAYLASRRSAKSFIKNKATAEDLNELKELIRAREESFNEKNDG